MKSEDLFAAIGCVESSRLERTELTVNQSSLITHKEETTMFQKNRHHMFPNILIAILIIATLATTVFAAVGFILFDNPNQMIETLFGNKTGYDNVDWSVPDNSGNVAAAYHADRSPTDNHLSDELAPQAEIIGNSITYAGHTLTVDANMYDAATKCGFVTYTIDNPNGIRPYCIEPNGEVFFPYGELLNTNQYGKSYIIQEKCTDTRLCATFYYRTMNPNETDLQLRICFWAVIDDPESYMKLPVEKRLEFNLDDSPDVITIPANSKSNVHTASFGNDAVILSPFSVQVNLRTLPEDEYVSELTLTFKDGTKYIVKNTDTLNCLFEVGDAEYTENTFMLNRLINLDNISHIMLNGIEMKK